jgi:predicted amidohydrolase
VNSPSRGAQGPELTPNKTWNDMMSTYSKLLTSFYIFAHRVGYEDGVNFFGGSRVYSPTGEMLVSARPFEEEMVVANLDSRDLRRARINNPVMRDEKPEMVRRILKKIIL